MSGDRDAVSLFVTVLGVAESVAVALVHTGMTTLEELAYVPLLELLETPGVDPEILKQVREKARVHLAL